MSLHQEKTTESCSAIPKTFESSILYIVVGRDTYMDILFAIGSYY